MSTNVESAHYCCLHGHVQRAPTLTFCKRSLFAACSSRRCCSLALRVAFQAALSSSVIAASFAEASARFASPAASLTAFSAALRACFCSRDLHKRARPSCKHHEQRHESSLASRVVLGPRVALSQRVGAEVSEKRRGGRSRYARPFELCSLLHLILRHGLAATGADLPVLLRTTLCRCLAMLIVSWLRIRHHVNTVSPTQVTVTMDFSWSRVQMLRMHRLDD